MNYEQWHGTHKELLRLRAAIQANCACPTLADAPPSACPSHAMLAQQPVLDRLLFVYRSRAAFLAKEFAAG